MEVSDYPSLIKFIETTTEFTCSYELITLFVAIKIRDTDGIIDRGQLANFFLDFYKFRKANKLAVKKPCNPLDAKDLNETIQLLNRGPIGTLLKVGILKTFVRFTTDAYILIVENEEDLLSTLFQQIIRHYSEIGGEPRATIEKVLSSWEEYINKSLKKEIPPTPAAPEPVVNEPEKPSVKYETKHIKSLQTFYQQMQEEEEETQEKGKKKKKK